LKAIEEDLGPQHSQFADLTERVAADAEDWEEWYNRPDAEQHPMPTDCAYLDDVPRLILLRVFRADRVPFALTEYVKKHLGDDFVNQPPFHMARTYRFTTAQTPCLFILYPGVDPTSWVEDFGRTMNISAENGMFANISMGQGQEARADSIIDKMSQTGGWVFLQNVHLMQTWLPTLDERLETLTPHPQFRVFISAEPPPISYMKNIPEGLLQSCICISNEPPSDLKANMTRAWTTFSQQRIDASSKPGVLKACMFGLAFFHSVMLGRRRFGFQGWSRAYGFNMGDLKICGDILDNYLQRPSKVIPWQDLRYIFGEIMYGGHITDYFDRRTNNTYLSVIFNDKLTQKMELAPKLQAPNPNAMDYKSYAQVIAKSLPAETPLIYGLHPNAEIGFLTSNAETLFDTMMRLDGASDSSYNTSSASSSVLRDTLSDLMKRCPTPFNLLELADRSKARLIEADGPFIVVLIQECTRINALVTEMSSSLDELQKGLNGQLNMSQGMEDMAQCLELNQVPGRNPFHVCNWERLAWASRKSLFAWFADLLLRRQQLKDWAQSLTLPYSVWLPGLINPTALLTAIKQVLHCMPCFLSYVANRFMLLRWLLVGAVFPWMVCHWIHT
jgi:dynein heavy chain